MNYSVRSKCYLAIAVGALVPGLMSLWQLRTASATADKVVRAEIETIRTKLLREVPAQWSFYHRILEYIAADSAVIRAAKSGRSTDLTATLIDRFQSPAPFAFRAVQRITVLDERRNQVYQMVRGAAPTTHWVADTLPIRDTGGTVGWLVSDVPPFSLVPGLSMLSVANPRVKTGIRDRRDGRMIPGFSPGVMSQWHGEPRVARGDSAWLFEAWRIPDSPLDLVIAARIDDVTARVRNAALSNALALLAGIAVSMVVASMLLQRVVTALSGLARSATTIARGDLVGRISATGGSEFVRVAAAFNDMADNLARTLRRLAQRETLAASSEFAARLAHEVRNPLTSLKIDAQRLQRRANGNDDGTAARLLSQLDRLERYVDDTLSALRWEKRDRRVTDLSEPLRAAAHAAGAHFAERGAVLDVSLPGGLLWARVDAWAIQRATLNLLINAAQAVGARGHAWLTASHVGSEIRINIADNGGGIPETLRDRVFDVFYTTKRDGSGLGLSIAQEIVEEHGGSLQLGDRAGGGTSVEITLPSVTGAVADTPTTGHSASLAQAANDVVVPVTTT